MIINDAGRKIIQDFETLQLTAYLCPAGVPTIGWGHTRDVTRADVKNKRTITKHEAEEFFELDLQVAEAAVAKFAPKTNGNQFSALVSFCFNVGVDNFKNSTLLKRLNAGQPLNAAAQFDLWVYAKDPKTGKMVKLNGLIKRRAQEKALFLTAVS